MTLAQTFSFHFTNCYLVKCFLPHLAYNKTFDFRFSLSFLSSAQQSADYKSLLADQPPKKKWRENFKTHCNHNFRFSNFYAISIFCNSKVKCSAIFFFISRLYLVTTCFKSLSALDLKCGILHHSTYFRGIVKCKCRITITM